MFNEHHATPTDGDYVHAGREGLRKAHAHVPPIDLSTTYSFDRLDEAVESLDAAKEGLRPPHTPLYARLANPTVDAFERAMADLEGAEDAVAFGSGMAAIAACVLASKAMGSHLVAVRPIYGGTDHLLTSGLLGLDTTWCDADEVAAHIRQDTALVIIETPANPTMALIDVADVVKQAGKVPVLVDATFATPALLQPLRHGAALSLHSATKFIGGHGDAMGGVVSGSQEWVQRIRQIRTLTGGVLHPMAAYLLHRGLQTLPMRVRAAQTTAVALARKLMAHPEVGFVSYPGLPGGDPKGLIGRQMAGPGTMVGFDVGTFERAQIVLGAVRLATPAVSLGSCDTLIQHPAGLTHRLLEPATLEHLNIGPGLLRLSVGLEDLDALWADLNRALSACPGKSAWKGPGEPHSA